MSDFVGFDTHESLMNFSIASRNFHQIFYAVFFPFPIKWDIVSQPVKAY